MKIVFLGFILTSLLSSVNAQNYEPTVIVQDSITQFAPIQSVKIPSYNVVEEAFIEADMLQLCKENRIDQLEKDFMFVYTASLPFEVYKMKEFKDKSGRIYLDVFPEENLLKFWLHARKVLIINANHIDKQSVLK